MPDTEVPEADAAEQQTPVSVDDVEILIQEEEDAIPPEADEADVLEQAHVVGLDEERRS